MMTALASLTSAWVVVGTPTTAWKSSSSVTKSLTHQAIRRANPVSTNRKRVPSPKRALLQMSSSSSLSSSSSSDNYNNNNENDNENNSSTTNKTTVRRVRGQISGVSVSSTGFWVIVQVGPHSYWPIRTTDDPMDAVAASSPEALTLLQLLAANVDMAGMVLPPEILSQALVLECEWEHEQTVAQRMIGSSMFGGGTTKTTTDKDDDDDDDNQTTTTDDDDDIAELIVEHIHGQLYQLFQKHNIKRAANDAIRYADQSTAWVRSRVQLPLTTLDEVQWTIGGGGGGGGPDETSIQLTCSIRDTNLVPKGRKNKKVVELQNPVILQDICYLYRPKVSSSFLAIALALRYKAPITVLYNPNDDNNYKTKNNNTNNNFFLSRNALIQRFPMYRPLSKLQEKSQRVVQNIERGFQYNQLQAALNIAHQKGDVVAAAKIQERMDEITMTSLQDNLPVQPESDTNTMQ